MKLRIAVVQFEVKQFAPEDNLKKVEKFIKKAALAQANIIVFPEDCVTGPIEEKIEFADGKHIYRNYFQKLAKEYGIDIVPGSFVEEEKSKLYNTTYYIDSTGEIKSTYRKVHLWLSERQAFDAGHKVTVAKTAYGNIGLAICWDLIFPEVFRTMVKKGVDIVICPSYWCYGDAGKGAKLDPDSEIKLVDSLCVDRAFEDEIIFVYCNAAGTFKVGGTHDILIGHSQITVPFKGAIKKLDHNKEEMFIQEVDTAILQVAEQSYNIRQDLKSRV